VADAFADGLVPVLDLGEAGDDVLARAVGQDGEAGEQGLRLFAEAVE
jgi:hypothetical protein